MSQLTETPAAGEAARARGQRADKYEERRAELAAATLQTLSELGYARTSLREIAQNSSFSHGVLHYYFRDKVDLITYCVRQYKAICVTRYDDVVSTAPDADALRTGFAAVLGQTVRDDAAMHRLWYDLRTQSLFEESFRADVAEIDLSLERMIWRVLSQYSALAGRPLTTTPEVAYALCDGLFQRTLFQHLAGDTEAAARLERTAATLLPTLLA